MGRSVPDVDDAEDQTNDEEGDSPDEDRGGGMWDID